MQSKLIEEIITGRFINHPIKVVLVILPNQFDFRLALKSFGFLDKSAHPDFMDFLFYDFFNERRRYSLINWGKLGANF